MSFKIKKQGKSGNNKATLELEISNSYFKKQVSRAYKNISQKANIPGFRKGKVPYQVIDANFGKQYVLNEAANLSISELYPGIIQESEFMPITYPKVKVIQIDGDKPLEFEIELELEPELKLPRYKGLEVEAAPVGVSDEELEGQIDNIRKNFASLEPVDEKKPVAEGDYVTIDFDGTIDGNVFEGGSAQDYSLEVGSNTLFEGFEEALAGMKKGENKDITLVMPENIGNKNLAGKKAVFAITLKEVKKRVLPDIDKEFLKNLGEYKDEEDFRKNIRTNLEDQKERNRKGQIIGQIMGKVMEDIKEEIPAAMIGNRVQHIEKDLEEGLKKQKINKGNYLKAINITEAQFNEEISKRAVQEVKEYLVFKAMEKAEMKNIEPSEKEIDEEKKNILERYKDEKESVKVKEYLEKPGGINELIVTLRRRKLIDLLITNSKIVEEVKKTDKIDKKKLWTPEKDKKEEKEEKEEKKLWTPSPKQKSESDDKNGE